MAKRTNAKSATIAKPKNKAQYLKLFKKGHQLYIRKNYVEAAKYLTIAWEYDATDSELLIMVSGCLFKMGRKSTAIDLMMHTLEASPSNPTIASTLGNVALGMNEFQLAQKFHQHYINLKPSDPLGYNNYASAMREEGKLDEAITFLQDVLPIFPQSEILWNTLGSIVAFRDGPGHAIVFYEECLKINPDNSNALNNVAPAYYSLGETKKAEDAIRKAIRISPDERSPHMYLSSILFLKKELKDAWMEYEWRNTTDYLAATVQINKIPYWRGEPLKNKKLLIFNEQGIGDEILFTWLNNQIIDEAEKVSIACEDRLVPLIQNSFPSSHTSRYEHRISHDLDVHFLNFPDIEVSEHDYQVSAGDIAKYKWTDYEDIEENSEPIILPSEDKIKHWKEKIDALPHKISVGIAWRSGLALANRSRNYASLIDWGPLLKHENINLINLQYGDTRKELKDLEEKTGIKIHNFNDLDLKDDFDGTTAMMKSLDLVVGPASAPTMQSQLAGVNTWFFVAGKPWWSFGETIPKWRQNTRIFAKNENDAWTGFIADKAQDFEEWLKSRSK